MPRQKRKSNKRSVTMGIALEIATLFAILMLARPDWIAYEFQFAERHQPWQQPIAPQEVKLPGHTEEQNTTSIASDSLEGTAPFVGVFPPSPPIGSPESQTSSYNPPAVVVPAGEWLPGYFDIVQFESQPGFSQDHMQHRRQPYRMSTPMHPWNGQHF